MSEHVGNGQKVSVEIQRDNYDRLKAKAASKRYNVKEFTNEMIVFALDKEEFAELIAPHLSIDEIEGNKATLKDTKKKLLVDVYFDKVNNELHCEVDKTTSCIHTKFMWIMPALAKLFNASKSLKDNTALIAIFTSIGLSGLFTTTAGIAVTVLCAICGGHVHYY